MSSVEMANSSGLHGSSNTADSREVFIIKRVACRVSLIVIRDHPLQSGRENREGKLQ